MQQQLIKAAAFHTQDPIMIKLDCFPILYERERYSNVTLEQMTLK